MRIMHVIDSLEVGGAERMLVDIANRTARDGHDVSVCITRSGAALAPELVNEISVLELGRRRRFDLHAMVRLARCIRSGGIQLLHGHGRSTFSLLVAMRMLGMLSIPVVFHAHYGTINLDDPVPLWIRMSTRLVPCRYVGVSEPLADWALKAGFKPEQVAVIANALDLSRIDRAEPANIRCEYAIPEAVPLGIVVAGLRHEKGVDTLLKAVSRLARVHRFKLLVIGGSRDAEYSAACREACDSMGLEETIVFAGERSDVQSILHEADFGVMPSRSESGPLVLIEYMAAALPFVSTRVGNIARTVDALGIPEFVDPDDPDALANAMVRLLKLSPEERKKRGASGRDVAFQFYDIHEVIGLWYAVYRGLLPAA